MVKQIKFTVARDGRVTVDVQGASGAECERLTKEFEEALGTVVEREHKESYYSSEALTEENTVQS